MKLEKKITLNEETQNLERQIRQVVTHKWILPVK